MQSARPGHKLLSPVAVAHSDKSDVFFIECEINLWTESPHYSPAWSVLAQDAGGVGPGLVSHTAEQHRVFPAPRPQPSPLTQTVPHRQPHRLRLRHRGAGGQLPVAAAPRHTG